MSDRLIVRAKRSHTMNRSTFACTRFITLLFALLLTVFPAAASARGTRAVASPIGGSLAAGILDLPAMTLTPSDLDAAGYEDLGLTYGGLETLEIASEIYAEIRVGATAVNDADYASLLRDAGWKAAHETYFASPQPNNPDEFSLRVWSIVTQYTDDDGAARAFAALSDGGEVTAFA